MANTSKERLVASYNRVVKRYLKQTGLINDKAPSKWFWDYFGVNGVVTAYTRSEAKSQIKYLLAISKSKRLPKEVKIEKVIE